MWTKQTAKMKIKFTFFIYAQILNTICLQHKKKIYACIYSLESLFSW
jgi:hypothetical protein